MEKKDKQQLGKILLKQKLVEPSELEELLNEQKGSERLASKALEKGLIDETKALKALSEQHGVPAIDLEEVEILLENLNIIPRDIATKHLVLPISVAADTIRLAMADPTDQRVVDEIEFVTGKSVFPHVALHGQMSKAIKHCYRIHADGEKVYRGSKCGSGDGIIVGDSSGANESGRSSMGTVIADSIPPPPVELADDLSIEIDIQTDDLGQDQPFSEEFDVDLSAPPQPLSSVPPAFAPTVEDEPKAPDESDEPEIIIRQDKPRSSTGKKVLVVDDEDDIRTLICRVLVDQGYEVITAARGLEAIKKLQSDMPDMVVLDAMLPEVHGFDICKKIKGSTKYGHIPVIMISAIYRGWRYAQDLKNSYGVDDFIEKPFKVNALVEMVEKYTRASTPDFETRKEEISTEAERSLTAGIDAYRAGNIDKAVGLLKKGIKIDPLAYRLHYHLALLLGKKGLNYQAIRALENALELAPDYFPALKNLAVLYQKSGFKFKAIETWERALGHCDDEETREGIKRQLVSLL